jgi:hypothetical protein
MRLLTSILAVFAHAALAAPAHAGISYNYVTSAPTYSASSGTEVVSVYLQETLTGASTSLINANQGLFSAAVSLNVTSGPGTITNVSLNTASVANNGFSTTGAQDLTYLSPSAKVGQLLEQAPSTGPSGAGPLASSMLGNGSGQVLLGTFTISNVTAATTLGLYSFANAPTTDSDNGNSLSFNVGDGNTLSYRPLDNLDGPSVGSPAYTGASANSYSFSVSPSAVPEPSSVMLTGLVLLAAGAGAWLRRPRESVAAERATAC